jgi:hypothetical protein
MSIQDNDLAVRRHERYGCNFAAEVLVAAASSPAVCLSRSAIGTSGAVNAHVVDLSRGGIGIRSAVFFPATSHLKVRFSPPGSPPIEAMLRVQRVAMSDVSPSYYVGGSLETPTPEQNLAIGAAVDALRAAGAPLVPEKTRA